MTQQEITNLKARFKAGGTPTQQDFETLIDAFADGGSSSTPSGPVIIHADSVLRNAVRDLDTRTGDYGSDNGFNPFLATTVSDLISAYEALNSTSLSDADSIVVINESWDFYYNYVSDASWEKSTGGFDGNFGSDTTISGISHANVPIYIKTKYANVMPQLYDLDSSGTDQEAQAAAENNPTEYNSSYESNGGHDPEYIIDVIPDGNAMMFVKRNSYTNSSGDSGTIDWVPVGRSTTLTVYELGQMEQDFASLNFGS